MATLKANGAVVFRVGPLAFMSNGKVLKKRSHGGSGGYKVHGKVKPGLTFQQVLDIFAASEVHKPTDVDAAWLPLRPAPTKRIKSGPFTTTNPGLLRAKVKQARASNPTST